MIKIKTLKWKNFLSYGNNWTEFQFKEGINFISGVSGSGKCLDKSTNLNVITQSKECEKQFNEFFEKRKMKEFKNVTLEDVYEFYKQYPHLKGQLLVETPFGYKEILDCEITERNSETIEIETENNLKIKGSPNHKVKTLDGWKKLQDLKKYDDYILTINGWKQLVEKKYNNEKQDLYDIEVKDVHQYYSNGIVSHNSSINDILYFSLFGKPYRKINIANLINSINKKNLLVYLEFEKNNKKYVIKRGLKPNIFEIYENGKLIDIAAHKTKYQKFLEEKILEFDENYFNQIIVKSLTKKISIFNFTKEEKRQLIDELFELQYITELKNKSKEILLKLKSDLKIEENNLSNLKQLIYQEEENIKKLKEIEENLKKEKEEKIKQIEKEIKNTTIEIENIDKNLIEISKLKDEYEKLKLTYKELSKEIKKIVEEKMKIEIEYNHSKDLYNKFYPVCKDCPKLKIITNFETYTEDDILKLKEKIEKLENEQNEIKTKIQNIKSFLNTEKILKNKKEILKQTIRKLEKEKIEIEKKNIDIKKSNKLEKLKTEYEKKKEQIIEIKDKIKQYKTITEIFSDTGIRKYIIKKYIEIINEFMNEFLDKFDLDIKFKIDENFDEVINSRFHKKFKYENFSEGEKKRIDLSLLFAILKFNSMRKGNKTNILILDEIIAGLDNISENNFYYILRTSDFLKDKCIYIISHSKGIDSTIFDRIYEVKKEKKFSKIIEK